MNALECRQLVFFFLTFDLKKKKRDQKITVKRRWKAKCKMLRKLQSENRSKHENSFKVYKQRQKNTIGTNDRWTSGVHEDSTALQLHWWIRNKSKGWCTPPWHSVPVAGHFSTVKRQVSTDVCSFFNARWQRPLLAGRQMLDSLCLAAESWSEDRCWAAGNCRTVVGCSGTDWKRRILMLIWDVENQSSPCKLGVKRSKGTGEMMGH